MKLESACVKVILSVKFPLFITWIIELTNLLLLINNSSLSNEVFNENHPEGWHYCCHPYYITMDDEERPGKTYDIIEFSICVYFPKSHFKKVFNQVRISNLKENRV